MRDFVQISRYHNKKCVVLADVWLDYENLIEVLLFSRQEKKEKKGYNISDMRCTCTVVDCMSKIDKECDKTANKQGAPEKVL